MVIGNLSFEYSPWFILLAILAGIIYAIIAYTISSPWSQRINIFLSSLRIVLVASIVVLLMGPSITALLNYNEKPIMGLAIDNSASLALVADSAELALYKKNIEDIHSSLINTGWAVEFTSLDRTSKLADLAFDVERTDITRMISEIRRNNEGLNLAGIILFSDGINNSGFSPDLVPSFLPIYTIGVGDTTQLKDLSISDVRFNKTVFEGNSFPLEVDIRNNGISSDRLNISVVHNDEVVDSFTRAISINDRIITHRFILDSEESGKQSYSIVIGQDPMEYTAINNRRNIYFDVIEGKQNILLVPGLLHPDLKAIKKAVEQNEHFAVTLAEGTEQLEDYDLVIFYQFPSFKNRRADFMKFFNDPDAAKFFIIGLNTDVRWLSRNNVLTMNLANRSGDFVTAYLADDFSAFSLSEDLSNWLPDNPPVSVPYGNVSLEVDMDVMLYQQVSEVRTKKPLLFYKNSEPRSGFLLAENFWRWRLDEFRLTNSQNKFDELITKTVQFLASKPDTRQFKMYPVKDEFEVGEAIVFETELYNELFETVYGAEIELKVNEMGQAGSQTFRFTPLPGSTQFTMPELEEGIFNYSAKVVLEGSSNQVSGQFVVEKVNLEAADLTADHKMLSDIATRTGGYFTRVEAQDSLINYLANLQVPAIIHTREKESSFLNFSGILIALIALASIEWFLRKFYGSY